METLINLFGLYNLPVGYEVLAYIVKAVIAVFIIRETFDLFKFLVSQSLRIGG